MTAATTPAGTCRICCCTEAHACAGSCSWVDDTRTLCSHCEEATTLAKAVIEIFGQLGPRMRPPASLPSPAWDDLTDEQQQLLIMAQRRTVERAHELLLEEFTQEAIEAMVAQRAIAQFLTERCPQQLREDDPLDEVVIRLLEPHVGSRIVLPGQGRA